MKRFSKVMTVLLAVMLLACMLPTMVFADGGETPSEEVVAVGSFTGGTVTINASNADDSFALYKVIDVTYNTGSNTVSYAFTTAAAAYNATLGASAPTIATYQGWANDSADLKNYLGGFAKYVKENSVAASYTGTAAAKVCTISGVAMGQYLVLGTGSATGAYVYQLMTATFKPNSELKVNTGVTLNSKASQPGITKTADDTQVATKDVVTYTITVDIPTYPANATNRSFVVSDVLPASITYTSTSSVKVDTTDLDASAYTFTSAGANLTWTINNFDAIKAGSKLTIVYTATVATDIPVTTGATNTAKLTYSNDPYGSGTHDITDTETVYSYAIELTKYGKDSATAEEKTLLSGVEFELYKDQALTIKVGGTYTTDASGKLTISGLDVGTYYLKETKAAAGYVLPASAVTVTVADTDKDGKVDDKTTGTVAVELDNIKGEYNLPQTGGIGTWVFTIVGVCLMAGAVILLIVSKKRSDKTN